MDMSRFVHRRVCLFLRGYLELRGTEPEGWPHHWFPCVPDSLDEYAQAVVYGLPEVKRLNVEIQ